MDKSDDSVLLRILYSPVFNEWKTQKFVQVKKIDLSLAEHEFALLCIPEYPHHGIV